MPSAADTLTAESASDAVGVGSAELTIQMKQRYDEASIALQMEGRAAPTWSEWLSANGFGLDQQGLVFKKQ